MDGEQSADASGTTAEGPRTAAAERADRAWQMLSLHIRSVTPSMLARFLLVMAALTGLLWILWTSWSVLLPFQVGAALAYLLLPLVNVLDRWIPRWAAILAVFTVGLLVGATLLILVLVQVVDQVGAFAEALPTTDQLSSSMTGLQRIVDESPPEVQEAIDAVGADVVNSAREHLADIVQRVVSTITGVFSSLIATFTFLLGFLAIPFWLYILLMDQRRGKQAIDGLLPAWLRADFWAVIRITDRALSGYIRGQLFLGLLVGVLSYAGLTLIEVLGIGNVRFKLVLAVIAGFTEMIPLLGPVLGGIPAVLFGLLDSWQTGLAVFILYFGIQQIESNLLAPRVIGRSVGIHPIVLMPLMIVLSQFGPLWIILAAPLAAVVRDLFRYVYGRLDDPPLPAGLLPGETVAVVADTGPNDGVRSTEQPGPAT
ncbi:MAG: AI-2E family transporter [Dehalococcoidia bacterium]